MKKITQFLFEMQHLKQIKHEGWRMAGVQFPDSVAEHSLSAAQIGTILALREGVDPARVATMLVWHDSAETRIGDIHKVAAKYLTTKKEAEKAVTDDQFQGLELNYIEELLTELYNKDSQVAIVAKDADYLEMAFQAKIYVEQGHAAAQDWLDRIGQALQTDTARHIRQQLQEMNSYDRRKEQHLKITVQ